MEFPLKLKFSEIAEKLPRREAFLHRPMMAAVDADIAAGAPIIFMPNDPQEARFGKEQAFFMYGILPCGRKACVVLTGFRINVDIAVPPGVDATRFIADLRAAMQADKRYYAAMETVNMYPADEFSPTMLPYVRVSFANLWARGQFIRWVADHNAAAAKKPAAGTAYTFRSTKMQTASDDEYNYFNKVAREYRFGVAAWNMVRDYAIIPDATSCAYTIKVDIANFRRFKPKNAAEFARYESVFSRDPMIMAQWDIETYKPLKDGRPPAPGDIYTIFNICSSYYFHYSAEPLVRFAVIEGDADNREGNDILIICDNEREVIRAHMEILHRMRPDILSAFNGSHFDWPLYKDKLIQYGFLPEFVRGLAACRPEDVYVRPGASEITDMSSRYFKSETIKINAENSHESPCVAHIPGMIDIDVMPIFLGLYPSAEVRKAESLNFFLASNKLESKEDMPYQKMFKIYERSMALRTAPAHCHCAESIECALCVETRPELDDDPGNLFDSPNGKQRARICCACDKRPRNAKDMADVAYYCTIDCVRPQQLCVKRAILTDRREVSNLAYVSLYASFFRANGMKVRNFVGCYSHKFDTAFSNARSARSDSEKDHYPGARVFSPNRGLHSDGKVQVVYRDLETDEIMYSEQQARPITGKDFSSLYPNLMRTYNLSKDRTVKTAARAAELQAMGYTLHHVKPFPYEKGLEKGAATNQKLTCEGWTVRHNGILSKADTHVVEKYVKETTLTYNDTTETLPAADAPARVAELRHSGIEPQQRTEMKAVRGRAALPNECMGVSAYAVKKLFDRRVPIKNRFVAITKLLERMEKNGLGEAELDGKLMHVNDIVFERDVADSKQRAVKLLTNCIYGESGNHRSSIYDVIVSGGITQAGRRSISKIERFVRGLGFTVHYGDTDSVYISCPDSLFAACDAEYKAESTALAARFSGQPLDMPDYKAARVAARVKWWTAQVDITMRRMATLTGEVKDFLAADNGTLFMTMAYEEVGYPAILTGRKKYCMTPHVETINFYPESPFIRGIDIIKQGQTPVSKRLGMEFIREALSPENEKDLLTLAEEKIREALAMDIVPEDYVQTYRWRTDKKNPTVLTFINRLERRLKHETDPLLRARYALPEPGDKFSCVIVKRDNAFTIRGTKLEIKKGDQLEYMSAYLASQDYGEKMEIDRAYYVKNQLVGVFARFICYHPMFQPARGLYDPTTKEGYKAIDEISVKAASKYLADLVDKLVGYDPQEAQATGRRYQRVFRTAKKLTSAELERLYGREVAYIVSRVAYTEDDKTSVYETITSQVAEIVREMIPRSPPIEQAGPEYMAACAARNPALTPVRLQLIYSAHIRTQRMRIIAEREVALDRQVAEMVYVLGAVAKNYEGQFSDFVEYLRRTDGVVADPGALTRAVSIDAPDADTIRRLYGILRQKSYLMYARAQVREMLGWLTETVCR